MTDAPTVPAQATVTMQELADTITGYDELGIAKAFGRDIDNLTDTQAARACGFVWFKRQGLNHDQAYDAVMQLGAKALLALFPEEPEEVMPEEPSTEVGKDATPQPGGPTSSPPSAS